jgi:hypothetical protein
MHAAGSVDRGLDEKHIAMSPQRSYEIWSAFQTDLARLDPRNMRQFGLLGECDVRNTARFDPDSD